MKTNLFLSILLCLASLGLKAQTTCNDPDICWSYTITADNHIIIIDSAANPTVNGNPLPAGSYIGVFFDSAGISLKSAGFTQWTEVITTLAAFGNDGSNPPVGFTAGQKFHYKLLLPTGEIADSVNVTYKPLDGFLISNTNLYENDGISSLASLEGFISCPPAGVLCDDANPCTSNDVEDGNCNCAGTFSNSPPVAIPGGPYAISSGQDLRLDASGSFDPDASCGDAIASYLWDFDSDYSFNDASGVNPLVSWTTLNSFGIAAAGNYTLWLRVTDTYGLSKTTNVTLTINACPAAGTACNDGNPCTSNDVEDGNCNCAGTFSNTPPVALPGGPYSISSGQDLQLDASGSFDPDASCGDAVVSYLWDFDSDYSFNDASGVNPLVSWTTLNSFGIAAAGNYTLWLRVTDTYGLSKTTNVTLTINACPAAGTACNDGDPCTSNDVEDGNCNCAGTFSNTPPVALPGGPYIINIGEDLQLDGSASYDLDSSCGDAIASYSWDLDNNGTFGDVIGTLPIVSWSTLYTFGISTAGSYNITLAVTDNHGSVNSGIASLTVNSPATGCGNIIWEKTFGGANDDHGYAMDITRDGGYIIAGRTHSSDGYVSGHHGQGDVWVIKLDCEGSFEWQNTLGGTGVEEAHSVHQTTDGGYIVAGPTSSNDGDVTGNHGAEDFWVIKLDGTGNMQWQKTFGGTYDDEANSIRQTTDGGYIVVGLTHSSDGDVTGYHNGIDYWVVKLDSTGILQWQKALGGTYADAAYDVVQTSNEDYVIVGNSQSNDGDVSGNQFLQLGGDYWIVRLNSNGIIVWQKCLGGTGDDQPNSIQQTSDGGFVIAGWSSSNSGAVSGNNGLIDYWVVKLSSTGKMQWQKSLGGSSYDYAHSVLQTSDGGFVIAGESQSNNGDVTGANGNMDFWVVKLDTVGTIKWEKALGGTSLERAYSICQKPNGDFVVAGRTNSDSGNGDISFSHGGTDVWVVKLSDCSTGSTIWTGSSSRDWFTPCNWDSGAVPDSTALVTIPDVSAASNNFPVISGGVAHAKTITVDVNATLDITNIGTLILSGN